MKISHVAGNVVLTIILLPQKRGVVQLSSSTADMSTSLNSPSNSGQSIAPQEANTVAVIGASLVGVTICLCGLLFWLVSQLPDGIEEFQTLENNTPAQMRLLVLGCSTALLTIVSLVLCLVGLVLPNRPRFLATVGALAAGLILLGIFGVLVVGAVLNPVEVRPSAADTNTVEP